MARILVIDDDELMRRTVARMLRHGGHDVAEAADGSQGLRLFRSDQRDVVITDIIMPEKEGIETIGELRAIAPEVRIIAMSGSIAAQQEQYLRAAKVLGADATIAKPFRIEELLSVVAKVLDKS